METLDPTAGFVMDDDLLNFSLDDEEDDEKTKLPSSSLDSLNPDSQDDHSRSFPVSFFIVLSPYGKNPVRVFH